MTLHALSGRLRRIEQRQGLHGELDRMTDAQLWAVIRAGYCAMAEEHGSLVAAAMAYREAGDTQLAQLIEEDVHRGRASDEQLS